MCGPFGQFVENFLNLFTGPEGLEEPFEVQVGKLAGEIFEKIVLLHKITNGNEFQGSDMFVPECPDAVEHWVFPPLCHNLQLYFMIVLLIHFIFQVGKLVVVLNIIFSMALPLSTQVFLNAGVVFRILVLVEMLKKFIRISDKLIGVSFFGRGFGAV